MTLDEPKALSPEELAKATKKAETIIRTGDAHVARAYGFDVAEVFVKAAARLAHLEQQLEFKTANLKSLQDAYDGRAALQERIAHLEAKAAAQGWQDIESAPKDGTQILVFGGTYQSDADNWGTEYPFPHVVIVGWNKREERWQGEQDEGHDNYRWHNPTHWMPLPAPPSASGSEEK